MNNIRNYFLRFVVRIECLLYLCIGSLDCLDNFFGNDINAASDPSKCNTLINMKQEDVCF